MKQWGRLVLLHSFVENRRPLWRRGAAGTAPRAVFVLADRAEKRMESAQAMHEWQPRSPGETR